MILTGEAQQLAGLENDLARINLNVRELSVYTSDASQTLKVELSQNLAATETLSKPIIDTAGLGVAEPSIAETIVEELGLHL